MADIATTPDLGERIRILEARAAIGDLIHRYALNIRSLQSAACADLFTNDGEFEIRDTDPAGEAGYTTRAHNIGREAVLNYIGGAQRKLRVFPMIRNLLIEVDGSTATSTCLMSSRTWPAGSEVFGEYQDSFREEVNGWRFTRRIFTMYKRPA